MQGSFQNSCLQVAMLLAEPAVLQSPVGTDEFTYAPVVETVCRAADPVLFVFAFSGLSAFPASG